MDRSSRGLLVFLMFLPTFVYSSDIDIKIGLLLDNSEMARRLEWDYDDYVRSWGIPGLSVKLERTDISDFNLFQLYNSVCHEVSNDTLVFITTASCPVLQSLSSLISRINVPIISVGEDCQDNPWATDDYLLNFLPEKPDMTDTLKGVLESLGWQDLVFVYGIKEATLTVDLINSVFTMVNATVQSFVVRPESVYSDVRSFLDYLHHYSDIKRHFVVLCDIDCLTEIFTQVNAYDKSADQQAWFTYDAHWVLIGERDILTSLSGGLGDVDNVAAIVPAVDVYNSSNSVVLGALAKCRWSLSAASQLGFPYSTGNKYPTVCGQKMELADLFSTELQMQLRSAACLGCSVYDVYSAAYVQDHVNTTLALRENNASDAEERLGMAGRRRQWELVGEWEEFTGLVMHTRVFPNVQHGLNGIHFVIGTNLWVPFVLPFDNSTSGFGGLCIEILDELTRNLNFSYEMIMPKDGQWGDVLNGTWTGLVGQLQTKVVDLTMAPLATNSAREEVVDFTTPYFLEYTTVLVKYANPSDTKWRLYINPFKWQVWLCVGLAIPTCGVIIWLMTRFNPYYPHKKSISGLGLVENAIFYTFGSFFTQGGVHLPEAQSGRFFIGFWWMYCMVVIATYSGNLIAFLTVSKATVPFQTLEELTSQNTHTYGTMGGAALEQHLRASKNGMSKVMWEQMQQFKEKDPDVLSLRHSVHIKKVLHGQYAYINDKTSFELEMAKETGCEIDMIKAEFIPFQYAIGLQNNSAYKPIFDAGGIVTESKAVSVSDVQGAYYLMAMFLGFSFLALFGEAVTRHKKLANTGHPEKIAEVNNVIKLEYDEFGRSKSTRA